MNQSTLTEKFYILEEGDDWINYPSLGFPLEIRDLDRDRPLACITSQEKERIQPMKGFPSVWYIDEDAKNSLKSIRFWPTPTQCTKFKLTWFA